MNYNSIANFYVLFLTTIVCMASCRALLMAYSYVLQQKSHFFSADYFDPKRLIVILH